MFYLALATGLRIGELLALKWEDIDLKAGKLLVKRTLWQGVEGTPKGGRRREVPLSVQTVTMLKAHRHLIGAYVFSKADGSHHTHNQLQDWVPRTCLLAGLPKRLTWHDLRHTFASHLVMRERSIVEVQQLLGHTTLAMALRGDSAVIGASKNKRPPVSRRPLSSCPRRDSNPYTFRRQPLKLVCLPVPPPGRFALR